MRFQTPQFIEIEDKIFGPFTLKQFIYLAGSAGLAFLLYRILPFFIALFLILPIIGLGLALTFYKPNNKPFVTLLESIFRYTLGKKLYIWRKDNSQQPKRGGQTGQAMDVATALLVPKLSDSKLKDLAWSLDVRKTPTEEANEVLHKGQNK